MKPNPVNSELKRQIKMQLSFAVTSYTGKSGNQINWFPRMGLKSPTQPSAELMCMGLPGWLGAKDYPPM